MHKPSDPISEKKSSTRIYKRQAGDAMSNPFPQGMKFVPVPRAVLEQCPEMTEAETKLYLALVGFAEEHTAVELHLPSYRITDYTGLHHQSIAVARRRLEDRGLITSRKDRHGRNIYILLDPVTHRNLPAPVHGKQHFKGVYEYAEEGRNTRKARKARELLAWDDLGGVKTATTKQPCGVKTATPRRQNRVRAAVSTPPPLLQTTENANTCVQQKKLSEESLKKEFLEKGFASSESSPFPQPERIIPVQKPKAIPIPEVKEESEPVTVRMMREPVIQRLVEKFGARIATTPDANADNVGLPYDEWMKREVAKQMGPGLPHWPKRQIYKQQ